MARRGQVLGSFRRSSAACVNFAPRTCERSIGASTFFFFFTRHSAVRPRASARASVEHSSHAAAGSTTAPRSVHATAAGFSVQYTSTCSTKTFCTTRARGAPRKHASSVVAARRRGPRVVGDARALLAGARREDAKAEAREELHLARAHCDGPRGASGGPDALRASASTGTAPSSARACGEVDRDGARGARVEEQAREIATRPGAREVRERSAPRARRRDSRSAARAG